MTQSHIIMFGDKDFTVYFGLVYNDIGNRTMTIITSPPEGVAIEVLFSPGLSVSVCPANILVFYFST